MTTLEQLALDCVADAERREKLSQWYTPPDLAARMAELADCKGKRVLEPSAGSGNLVRAALDAGADHVMCVDVDLRNQAAIYRRFNAEAFDLRVACKLADFLECTYEAPFDVALMNPPWDDGAHWKHILHALKFAPRVVALAPLAMLEGEERKREFWDKVWLDRLCVCAKRPAFGPEGGKMPVAAYDIRRRVPHSDDPEDGRHETDVHFWP